MTIGCPARVRTFLIGMLAAVLWSAPAAAAPRDDTLVVAFSTARPRWTGSIPFSVRG